MVPLPEVGVKSIVIFESLTTVAITELGGSGKVVTDIAVVDDVPEELVIEIVRPYVVFERSPVIT